LVPERARPILRGETTVMLRDDPEPSAMPSRSRTVRAEPVGDAPPGAFEALRAWRMMEAKAQSVPPYVIFHDTVLRDIAAVQPQSLDALGQIKGVGASKLDRYGEAVLRSLREAS
jgi:ATP-dependent DNA helicase RecQ